MNGIEKGGVGVEAQVVLDRFILRDYQQEIWDKIEKEGYRKGLIVLPRRAGKDITSWNLAIRQCLRKVCLVYYALPTYGQARKAIFDAIAIDGTKFLDYIPEQLVHSINASDMKIRFKNGSILQCIGADSYETSLVGTNPYAIVFSEWARCDQRAYEFARPILAANGGWCLMVTTPYGKNHAWQMWKLAQELPDWFVVYKKTSEIEHIPAEVIQQEREQMSEDLFLQEYECSWDRGVSGAYYSRELEKLRANNQIGPVAWEPGLQVHTAWDIGVNDATTIIFWQSTGDGTVIRIIDALSNNNVGLDWYAKALSDKPYSYGKHFAPHDISVREWGGGAVTRFEKARQIGVDFIILPQVGLMDGIENVLTHFPKFWIDKEKCKHLIHAVENYRREWDEERQMYREKPVKSWANHYSDALRYMCQGLHKTRRGMSKEDFNKARAQALYGNTSKLPQLLDPYFKYESYR